MKGRTLPMLRTLVLASFIFAAVAPAHAAPLAAKQVSADAKWLLHLDIEQFAPSQTCRILLDDPKTGERLRAMLGNYRNLLGADPLKALSGITLYGDEITGNRGVAVIAGTINAAAVTARLATYPAYTRRKAARNVVHRWTDPASKANLNACLYAPGLLVITSDDNAMDTALAVLDGSHSSLASKKAPALSVPAPLAGSFFLTVSSGYAGAAPHPLKAMLLRNTTRAAMQVAESKGIVDANIAMDAVSPDAALQIQQIVRGLIVSAQFADESSGLAQLAELSEVKRLDQQVVLRVHCPARDAAGALAAALLPH